MSRWERLTRKTARASVKAFGASMIFQYCDGTRATVCALLDTNHTDADLSGFVKVSSNDHELMIDKCQLTRAPMQGDFFLYRNVKYEVKDSRDDGFGSYRIQLWEVKNDAS